MRKFLCMLLIVLLALPVCALADLKRGDSGDDALWLQQMLWETGFLFEEPDGVFGKNTEAAVKEFQEYAGLEPSGTADDETMEALYACWLSLMEGQEPAEDEMESQGAGFVPDDGQEPAGVEGDFPVCCQRYITGEGDEHIELCGRHAALAEDAALSAVEKWTQELNALYDEWLACSPEEDRAAIASSQALFTLWLEQQTAALEGQHAPDMDAGIEMLLRSQCADVCRALYELQGE